MVYQRVWAILFVNIVKYIYTKWSAMFYQENVNSAWSK